MLLRRLSEGICHKALWAGRRAPRQLAGCCRHQPCPQVSKPFPALLFPFWNSCPPHHHHPAPAPARARPPFINCPASVWQTKQVSPLIRKAGFLAAWRHLRSNTARREASGSHLHRLQPRSAQQGRSCAPPPRWRLYQPGRVGGLSLLGGGASRHPHTRGGPPFQKERVIRLPPEEDFSPLIGPERGPQPQSQSFLS